MNSEENTQPFVIELWVKDREAGAPVRTSVNGNMNGLLVEIDSQGNVGEMSLYKSRPLEPASKQV